MKLFNKILVILLMVGFSSCQMFDLDLQDNPNQVTPDGVGVDFLYNNVQLSFKDFYNGTWGFSSRVTRMTAMTNFTYNAAFQAVAFNGIWRNAYSRLFADVETLTGVSDERGLDIHSGTSKIMKAYVMVTLVDMFGDVPYSEALQGTDIISPKPDDGQVVYNAAEALIDEAIAQLSGTVAAAPASDLFYGGDAAKWITFANTLKLKMYLNQRLVDQGGMTAKINALIAAGDIIDSEDEDFVFQYSTERNLPNSRHPFYNNSYENNDGAYQSNYYMWLMRKEKQLNGEDLIDPRLRFYIYRQDPDLTNEDENIWDCIFDATPFDASGELNDPPAHYTSVDPRMPYCIASVDGYFGRDHGNGSGIPPDGQIRAVYGLYPAGGSFDDNSFDFTQNQGVDGAQGVGINPIMLASFVDFMRAEAALELGTSDDARAMLESAINKSMDKVFGFQSLIDGSKVVGQTPDGDDITLSTAFLDNLGDDAQAYVDYVLAAYDAGSDDEKLDIIIKEYYLAAYGNGVEVYNMLRRTGKPANIQPGIEPSVGDFIRSALYPAEHVNLNANVQQKSITDKVFWDTNPDGFVR